MDAGGASGSGRTATDAASTAAACSTSEERQCRLCWSEEDNGIGGKLIAPCSCSGSSKYIHARCLKDWQDVLRGQGMFRKARHCEVCREAYKVPRGHFSGKWTLASLVTQLNQQLLEMLNCQSWPVLLYRVWKLYIIGSCVMGAGKTGLSGLKIGFGLGKSLVEEQTSLLLQLLSAMADLFGTPYAELMWCQAVACLAFAMGSEVLYASLLGLGAGAIFGFFKGWYEAMLSTFNTGGRSMAHAGAAGRGVLKLVGMAGKWPLHAVRAAFRLACRRLPMKLM